MKIADLEKKIDLVSLIEQDHNLQKVGRDTYRIDPCPVCGNKEHFTVYPKTNSYSSFSECCKGGSVYKYLQEVKGLNEDQAYRKLHELAGEIMREPQDNFEIQIKNSPSQPAEVKGAQKDFTNWINELYQKQTTNDKKYFVKRGVHPSLIEKYKLSIYRDRDGRRAMLPVWEGDKVVYYTTRAIDGQEPKYKNSKGSVKYFNLDYIQQEQDSPIFITEGIFDALTLETWGYKAIAINSASNATGALQAISDMNTHNNILITALDNDEAGKQAAEKFPFIRLEIPKQYKDVNEWGLKENIKESIDAQLEAAKQPDMVTDYLEQAFNSDIERMKPYKDKKTGFDNLDKELQGVYPGLYVVGGISSVGKTTFVHQLGDQMAEQGDHVIFFSLEQSKMEMVSKSIARTTAKIDINRAVSSVAIRSGYKPNIVGQAINEYKDIGKRVNVVEGNFNTNVHTIRNYVENYMKLNNTAPIVIVDYLQIMPALNDKMNDKQRVDINVTELKRMSRDLNISVFVISSLNRGNYLSPIDFESFKESGGIEYTADVVLGLQLEAIHQEIFESKEKLQKKRKTLNAAKNQNPRQIELVCLKNRNGKPSFSCSFSYWAKHDFYEANKDGSFTLDFNNTKDVEPEEVVTI